VFTQIPFSELESLELSPTRHPTHFASGQAVQLIWYPPTDTGGTPITEYVIERRGGPMKSFSSEWVPVLTVPGTQTKAVIPSPMLAQRTKMPYLFRVRAVNRMGASSPLEVSQPLYLEEPTPRPSSGAAYQVPAAPKGPLRYEVLPHDGGIHLEWESSPADEIKLEESVIRPTGYIIEAAEADKLNAPWIELCRVPGSSTGADIQLPTKSPYKRVPMLYRVTAENEFGLSAPLVTRIEPRVRPLEMSEMMSGLPRFSSGYFEARILPQEYPDLIPRIELHWPSLLKQPSLLSGTVLRGSDIGYLVEARHVGESEWEPIGSLPLGQETLVYRPLPPDYAKIKPKSSFGYGIYPTEPLRPKSPPVTEAYQFRVAPRTQLEVGEFLESNIVSWIPKQTGRKPSPPSSPEFRTISAPSPLAMRVKPPPSTFVALPPPERFQLTDIKIKELPEKSGSVLLRWHPPVGMSSSLRSASEFVVEAWQPERQQWWPVARTSAAISAETVPGRYEMRIEDLPLDQLLHFRILTENAASQSEPIMLPQPVFLPNVDATKKGQ
jgi:hypothetical protein